nr:MAG TPA: cullin family protein [Bacteriophage sp.]
MDKLSRAVLDDVSQRPDEYKLFYVRDILDSTAETFHVDSARFQSCIEDLETKGYLKFRHNSSGEILGFSPTYSGYRWKVLSVLKILDVVVFHILLPVIASVVTSLILA